MLLFSAGCKESVPKAYDRGFKTGYESAKRYYSPYEEGWRAGVKKYNEEKLVEVRSEN